MLSDRTPPAFIVAERQAVKMPNRHWVPEQERKASPVPQIVGTGGSRGVTRWVTEVSWGFLMPQACCVMSRYDIMMSQRRNVWAPIGQLELFFSLCPPPTAGILGVGTFPELSNSEARGMCRLLQADWGDFTSALTERSCASQCGSNWRAHTCTPSLKQHPLLMQYCTVGQVRHWWVNQLSQGLWTETSRSFHATNTRIHMN